MCLDNPFILIFLSIDKEKEKGSTHQKKHGKINLQEGWFIYARMIQLWIVKF